MIIKKNEIKNILCVNLSAMPDKLLFPHSFLFCWTHGFKRLWLCHIKPKLSSWPCGYKESVCWRVMVAKEPVFNKVIGSKMGKKPQLSSREMRNRQMPPPHPHWLFSHFHPANTALL